MPFALVLIGLAMIISGVKGTDASFGALLQKDFTGEKNFTWWLAAIGGVGSLGYIKPIEPLSRLFLVLIIIVLFLSNGAFFSQLTATLASGPHSLARDSTTSGNSAAPGSIGVQNPSTWWDAITGKGPWSDLLTVMPRNPAGKTLGEQLQPPPSGSTAAQNFSTFVDKIVPFVSHLMGLP